jgi:hypothetical protein
MSNQDPFTTIETKELDTVNGGVHGHHKNGGHKKPLDGLGNPETVGSLHRHRRHHHG